MQTISVTALFSSLGYDYISRKDRCIEIGDKTAVRIEKKTKVPVRANYERGLLLASLADKFSLIEFLEIGTGRGFVSGCVADLCPVIRRIVTVDKSSSARAENLLRECSVDIDRIRFVSADSQSLTSKAIGGSFDLFFLDGLHTGEAIRNDIRLALSLAKKKFIAVFDDYSNKFSSLKKEIDKIENEGVFDSMIAVRTDGEIFAGNMTERLMVIGTKGFTIAQ